MAACTRLEKPRLPPTVPSSSDEPPEVASNADKCPPADVPKLAKRVGSSPNVAAFARSQRTAPFTSWTCAGKVTDSGANNAACEVRR